MTDERRALTVAELFQPFVKLLSREFGLSSAGLLLAWKLVEDGHVWAGVTLASVCVAFYTAGRTVQKVKDASG